MILKEIHTKGNTMTLKSKKDAHKLTHRRHKLKIQEISLSFFFTSQISKTLQVG